LRARAETRRAGATLGEFAIFGWADEALTKRIIMVRLTDTFFPPESPWRIGIIEKRRAGLAQAAFKNGTLRNLRDPPCCEK